VKKPYSLFFVVMSSSLCSSLAFAQQHSFTVAADVATTQFGCPFAGDTQPVTLSPNGEMFVVQSEHGLIKQNVLQDELRIYKLTDLRRLMYKPAQTTAPKPIWSIVEATNRDGDNGCLISRIRWLRNSEGVAFLLRNETGHSQLFLATVNDRKVTPLSPGNRNVTGFEIRDNAHYVLGVASTASQRSGDLSQPAAVITQPTQTALGAAFPEELRQNGDRSELWAAAGVRPAPIIDSQTGRPIILYWEGTANMALSPDGDSLITALAVQHIPKEWEVLFPPPYPEFITPIKSGFQDVTAPRGVNYVSQYVRIGLKDGVVVPLVSGPTAERAGWWANFAAPAWSDDGSSMILPGAFPPNQDDSAKKPCVAVRDLLSMRSLQCLLPLKRNLATGAEPDFQQIANVRFAPGKHDTVIVAYHRIDSNTPDLRMRFKTFVRDRFGIWTLQSDTESDPSQSAFSVHVNVDFRTPPTLVATDAEAGHSLVIWDPNPQLKSLDLGEASLYNWKDKTGGSWSAILYKPANFVAGKRYPLVIETHGYNETQFEPSGGFPSAFAAQELASAGIVVLHMRDWPGRGGPMEGPGNVMGYESAVEQLTNEGLVDPERVGITGFSRTVSYVMEALATSRLHFAAASITDGINLGYFQHILHSGASAWTNDDYARIGARPYGAGLKQWLERSPEFNMDKVTTPLRVVSEKGGSSILYMWEPFVLLREMNRPVEFVILDTTEHVVTNPAVRLAAQGGNVDWYRFWLQGYEDPDPSKVGQYGRWEALRGSKDRAIR
jgi:dipeptidyl aminopeptidase/acylaminoacyl peptidase